MATITEREILQACSSKDTGRHCVFVPGREWGVKVYISENMRDRCYKWQTWAADYNLGPITGRTFEIGRFFCYETEIAEVPNEEPHRCNYYDEIQDILDKLERNFSIQFCDNCWFNFGYVRRNGRRLLVLIDWDMAESQGLDNSQYEEWDTIDEQFPQDWMDEIVYEDADDVLCGVCGGNGSDERNGE